MKVFKSLICFLRFFKSIFEEKMKEIEPEEFAMAFLMLEKENEDIMKILDEKSSLEVF